MDRPQLGMLVRLASDAADAGAILAIARQIGSLGGHVTPSAKARVMRENLYFIWEYPRLPRPLIANKYPASHPWSHAARTRYEDAVGRRPSGGWGLVLEHMHPRRLLINTLLKEAQAQSQSDVEKTVGLLHE